MHEGAISKGIELYNELKPKIDKSEYTVLSFLCDNATQDVLALATGTQASIPKYPDDITDCHAESLVKRAYKRHLIEKIRHLICQDRIEKTLVKSALKQSLALYISQFPCGLIKRYESGDQASTRKPGRGLFRDGSIHYVDKSCCLEKLIKWASTGMQGKQLQDRFGITSMITDIFIAKCEPNEFLDYQNYASELEAKLQHRVKVHIVDGFRFEEFVYQQDKRPQATSLAWWKGEVQNLEFIVDGRRKGLTKAQAESGNARFELRVSSSSLRRDSNI